MDDARKLLDSLMGTSRDASLKEAAKTKGQNFKADNICKFYLVGFCPQHEELFHSTKRDIGECHKVHSDAMKAEFENHPEFERYKVQYENQLRHFLEGVAREGDEWVAREKRNIAQAKQLVEDKGISDIAKIEIDRVQAQSSDLLKEAESLAEAGDLAGSKAKMAIAELMQQKATEYEVKARTIKREEVCEECGLRMESEEDGRFIHFQGKIHLGYVKVRSWLKDLRERERIRERDGGRNRSREKNRSRGGDRARRRDARDRDAREQNGEGREAAGRDVPQARSRSRKHVRRRSRDRGCDRDGERNRELGRDRDEGDRRCDPECEDEGGSGSHRGQDRGRDKDGGRDNGREHGRERHGHSDQGRERGHDEGTDRDRGYDRDRLGDRDQGRGHHGGSGRHRDRDRDRGRDGNRDSDRAR